MVVVPVLRYIVGRLVFVGIVLAVVNVYAPAVACAPGGQRSSLMDAIQEGNERIAEVFREVGKRLN